MAARPVILIGMPGAGKTYWAHRWAEVSGKKAIDLDAEIEKATGQTIPEIFAERGEVAFRKIESDILCMVLQSGQNILLASGGGTPCFGDNLAQMRAAGKVIYLQAPVPLLAERILQTPNSRPLLAQLSPALLTEQLERMLAAREPFYRQAHLTVPVHQLTDATFDL